MERPNSRASMRKDKELNGRPKKEKARTTHGYPGNFLNSTYATTLFNKGYSFCDPYLGVFGPQAFSSNQAPPPYTDLLQKPFGSPYSSPYGPSPYHGGHQSPYGTEPTSLPLLGPWSSPRTMRPSPVPNPNWDVWSPVMGGPPKERPRAPPTRFNNGYLWIPDEDDFASLPPQVADSKSPRQSPPRSDSRRFSDPGLNLPPEEGEKEEASSKSSEEEDEEEANAMLAMQGGLMQRLLMEMGALRAANQNLQRELSDTKMQLETVQARQNSSWRKLGPDYHPGMFAEMIREVREASRMRDEAMLSRLRLASSGLHDFNDLRSFLENQSNNRSSERPRRDVPSSQRPQAAPRRRSHRTSRGSLHGSRAESSIDEDESSLSGDLLSANAETASCSSPPANPNIAGVLAEQVTQLQRDKQLLSDELKLARESRAETEAHVQKLERLVGILRKKITTVNGVGGSVGDIVSIQGSTASSSPTSSLEPVITGALSQVTIHGPVTNL